MGLLFGKKKTQKVILPDNAKCSRCGKRIKDGQEFMYVDKKIYCVKCGQAKRDWDFLELHALFDD